MAWVIDTCILLDIALPDTTWFARSAALVAAHAKDGLIVCPVTHIELTPHFGSNPAQVEAFLNTVGADFTVPWLGLDTRTTAQAWARYVEHRRRDRIAKRPVADLMIGAFARRHQGLLTRNAADFEPWFDGLTLVHPN